MELARMKLAADKSTLPVGRRVVVIGGGNTAIDIAVQTKRLGAGDVTIVYRRGPDAMGATHHEQELAQINGVKIKHWARPVRLASDAGRLARVEFESTALDAGGRLTGTGMHFAPEADMLFKAIGQVFVATPLRDGARDLLELSHGRIAVDGERRTSLPDVWAGGDCVEGPDLTVSAVQDGKLAAHAIDRHLRNA